MSLYGETMLQVQSFELKLAALVYSVETSSRDGGQRLTHRQLDRAIVTSWHLVHKASASELRRRLEGKIADALSREIETLISWRDFLAHRYLWARLVGRDGELLGATSEHATELANLSEAFANGGECITEAMQAALGRPNEPVRIPDGTSPRVLGVFTRLVFAQPQPFESVEVSGRAEPE